MKLKSCLGLIITFILFIIIGVIIFLFHFRNQIGLIADYHGMITLAQDSEIMHYITSNNKVSTPSELSSTEWLRQSLEGLNCDIVETDEYISVKYNDEEAKFYIGEVEYHSGGSNISSPFSKVIITKNDNEYSIDFYDLVDKQIDYGGN